MRVIVLGCGGSAGVPMIGGADGRGDWGCCDPAEPRNRRTRASIIVEAGDGRILLVDTGPDLRTQLLTCAIRGVDAILFTHAHADHVSGIDEVRGLNRVAGRPLPAYGLPETMAELGERFGFAFLPWTPPGFFRPVLQASVVQPEETVSIEGLSLRLFSQTHGRTRTLGFRTGAFAYSTDVHELGADALNTLRGVDTWLVDAFQREPHPAHAHVGQVARWAVELGVRRTILTHMGTDLDWRWLTTSLPDGLEPAFDGMALAF